MTREKPREIRRSAYRPPDYRIDAVRLDFDLRETETRVRAELEIHREPVALGDVPPLVLDGEGLETLSVGVDGRQLAPHEYALRETELELPAPPERFTLTTQVRIHPEANTTLSGLYKSGGSFCTQCEAHGFRRITWFLDRPDVMSRYSVRLEADAERYPVLLSNGNRGESERLADGRHAVRWSDPHPKPCYLFALVAGDLRCVRGQHTTPSGRQVELEIWVEPRNLDRCDHALRSLQRAMRWDEEVFGLEVDLDLYMIVAVDTFNMGAMENKGLNLFNSKYVLARPETATDDEYEAIEAVIGHEYFHNWTGNRVTCRDWFQLTLKEGLTVFRDQQFTADMTSAPLKRIHDVATLRSHQFPEDAGPLAHPIRPEVYIAVDNFYTPTVYEKGAEVIRLYHTLLGAEGFRRGMDLYFERHDGQAVTCDDFRSAMQDANDADLGAFERWYSQAGTPRLEARGRFDAAAQRYHLTLRQQLPETAAATPREPLPIPVRLALLGAEGRELPLRYAGEREPAPGERVLRLEAAEEHFEFDLAGTDPGRTPVPSLLRSFSAPVKLDAGLSREELAFLFARDTDPVSRWDAGQTLAREVLLELASDAAAGRALELPADFEAAMGAVLADPGLDGSLCAAMLELPPLRVLAEEQAPIDFAPLLAAREFARAALARAHRDALEALAGAPAPAPYRPDKVQIDARRLRNTALAYLAALEEPAWTARLTEQFESTDNMTDRQAALQLLVHAGGEAAERALAQFHDTWRDDPLVLDKWFSVQALSRRPDSFERVVALTEHVDFAWTNPNRVRALLGAFATGNPARFHAADGAPYALLADAVLRLDPDNPQLAARLLASLNAWRRFAEPQRGAMHEQLERIAATRPLAPDVFEIASRALAETAA